MIIYESKPERKKVSADRRIEAAALAVIESPVRYGGEESLIVKVSRATIARLEKENKK